MSDDLADQGGRIADSIGKIAERVAVRLVAEVAAAIASDARALAPRDTGNLANSIAAVQVDPNNWDIGTNVEYAPYQEFGTKYMAAQPFLIPAMKGVIGNIPDRSRAIFQEEQGK